MNVYEMLERIREYDEKKQRVRILRDLNVKLRTFARENKLLTAHCDLFTQTLVDSDLYPLTDEMGNELVSASYGSEFPLPSDCYEITEVQCDNDDLSYTLKDNVLRFYLDGTQVEFTSATVEVITLWYNKVARKLKEDHDAPEFHEDFHEGPLWMLLADYAATKGDKNYQVFVAYASNMARDAAIHATRLGRQSYDVQPFDWRK
jgi:hypothetical protein